MLPRPGLRPEVLLGMQAHGAPHARQSGAHRALELECGRFGGAAGEVGSGRHGCPVSSHLSGRTGTGAPLQVDDEVILVEVCTRRPPQHAGTDLALLYQLGRAHAIPGIARQHVHHRDQLAVGVHP